MSDTTQVYVVFIRTTPEKLWEAITKPEFTVKYFHGSTIRFDGRVGGRIDYTIAGKPAVDGEILEVDPPRKLVHSWLIRYDDALAKERSRVTWEIEKRGTVCKLTTTHQLAEAPLSAKHVAGEGWGIVLSGLKSLLETGEPLVIETAATPSPA